LEKHSAHRRPVWVCAVRSIGAQRECHIQNLRDSSDFCRSFSARFADKVDRASTPRVEANPTYRHWVSSHVLRERPAIFSGMPTSGGLWQQLKNVGGGFMGFRKSMMVCVALLSVTIIQVEAAGTLRRIDTFRTVAHRPEIPSCCIGMMHPIRAAHSHEA
jgi:hypothetical protein